MPRALTTLLAAAGLLGAAPLAAGAPAWVPPEDPSGPPAAEAFAAQVAMASRGDAVAVWLSYDDAGTQRVAASVRTLADLVWSPDAFISAPRARAREPRVAAGPSGEAAAVWLAGDEVRVSVRPAGAAAWEPPRSLSSAGRRAEDPRVAVTPAGDVVVAWRGVDGDLPRIEAAVRLAAAGSFSAPRAVSAPGEPATQPDLAAGAAGAVVVWRRGEERGGSVRAAALVPGAAAWTAPHTVSAPGAALAPPRVAVNDAGLVVVGWTGRGASPRAAQVASGAIGGDAWEAAADVSPPGADAADVRVGVGADGGAVALWTRGDGGPRRVQAAARPAGAAAWGAPTTLSDEASAASDPDLAVSPAGAALASWRVARPSAAGDVVAAARTAAGAWGAPAPLDADVRSAAGAEVALDAVGNGVAVWEDGVIRSRGYDAAGPLLSVSVPAAAATGQALALAAVARDLWSAQPGPPVWALGDGTPPRAGGGVAHAYAAPGRYRVTVTAQDALGNASTAEQTVVVTPPPPPVGAGAGPAAEPAGAGAPAVRRRAVRARLSVTARALAGRRVRLLARGSVTRPTGAALGAACRGRVVVSVRAGRRVVGSGAARLAPRRGRCLYRRAVVVSPPRGVRRLSVRVAFAGGATLAPARSRTVTVRLP